MFLSCATDGIDGPTDAAGGMVDSGTLDRGKAAGMDADRYLSDNNSYEYLQKTGDLVVTGPTNTNVDDLMVALVF